MHLENEYIICDELRSQKFLINRNRLHGHVLCFQSAENTKSLRSFTARIVDKLFLINYLIRWEKHSPRYINVILLKNFIRGIYSMEL
jgi:hypothetical protein